MTEHCYLPGDILIPSESVVLGKMILPKSRPVLVLESIVSKKHGTLMYVRSICSHAYNANNKNLCEYVVPITVFDEKTEHIKAKEWDSLNDRCVLYRNAKQLFGLSSFLLLISLMILFMFSFFGIYHMRFYLIGLTLAIATIVNALIIQADASKSIEMIKQLEQMKYRSKELEYLYFQYTSLARRDLITARKPKTIAVCYLIFMLLTSVGLIIFS